MYGIVLAAFFAFFALYKVSLDKGMFTRTVGEKQNSIYESYQKGEEVLYYIEESAKYAAPQAVHELAEKGGMPDEPCGTYNGYVMWGEDCFPDRKRTKQSLSFEFEKSMEPFDEAFPGDISNNYSIELDYNEMIFYAGHMTDIAIFEDDMQIIQGNQISFDEKPINPEQPTPDDPDDPQPDIPDDPPEPTPVDNDGYVGPALEGNPRITSCFEVRDSITTYHHGLDFSVVTGTEVMAISTGTVVQAEDWMGYGNVVKIEHQIPDSNIKYWSVYGHLSEMLVERGDTVNKGQLIALSGNTGDSTGPHLHLEIRLGENNYNNAVNPVWFAPEVFGNYVRKNPNNPECTDTPCDWQSGAVCSRYNIHGVSA